MVAELRLLVVCSSFRRSGGGTSSTERYTLVSSPMEMKMVDVFNVTRGIAEPGTCGSWHGDLGHSPGFQNGILIPGMIEYNLNEPECSLRKRLILSINQTE